MKNFTFVLFFVAFLNSYSQSISVDDTYNSNDLVNLVLNNSCLELLNTSISTGQSVGYFNKNGSSFPLNEGVVIRNGLASYTAGNYTGNNLSSPLNTNSDSFLQNLSNVSSGLTTPIRDVAFLEFDFKPAFNSFSFDFLFASNEYGEFQCISNDIFAFVLTDLVTGISTNLAVIPGTTNPVAVKNIRNAAYNSNCSSTNPGYFGAYNVTNPLASAINMKGQTTVLTAFSNVIPNNPYKIRIVIADYGDADYDSAIFIGAGSFETTFDLGSNRQICSGDSYILNTGLGAIYSHQWFLNNNPISGANSATYEVTQPGVYKVRITKDNCFIEDTITFSNLAVSAPQNLVECNTGAASYSYNLAQNNTSTLGLDSSIYSLYYYNSTANIASNSFIPSNQLTNYLSSGNETIYIKLFNTLTAKFCDAVYSFQLNVVQISLPENITVGVCENQLNYSLNQLNSLFNEGVPSVATINYFSSQANATTNSNPITTITGNSFSGTFTLWVKISFTLGSSNCFDIVSFTFTIHPSPIVDILEDVIACSQYELQPLTNGNYFTLSGGSSTPNQVALSPGDIINTSGTYYIYSGPNENGCFEESSFTINFIEDYQPTLNHCGIFRVPNTPYGIGNFYTNPGGPNGGGSIIATGTQFQNTTNATQILPIYYYSEIEGTICSNKFFEINIYPLPQVETRDNVTVCNSYTLPPLSNGNYFTGINGGGIQLAAGATISTTLKIYIYNHNTNTTSTGENITCSNQSSFMVYIINPATYTAVTSCGSFRLPPVEVGGYFDQPNGNGNQIPANSLITTSQNVYYFANVTENQNCTDNLFYQITIYPLPEVDVFENIVACGEFILPALTHGTYYKLSGGPSVSGQVQYFPNQVVDFSGTALNPGMFYIYVPENEFGCDNESSFTVTIRPLPMSDSVMDRIECNPYSINTPINGVVYTAPNGPNGTGSVVTSTQIFSEDKTFYIYSQNPTTGCKTDVPFTVFYNGVSLPNFADVYVCENENYYLTPIVHSPPAPFSNFSLGYFYAPGGVNPIPPNMVFNTPNTTTTIYVYAINQGRFGITCIEERSFDIIVSETPVLPSYNHLNGNYCGSFTLPTLTNTNYTYNYYSNSGGNSSDLIETATFTVNPGEEPLTLDFWVFAHAPENINCFDETHFQVTIYPLLTFEMENAYLCIDPISSEVVSGIQINSGLPSNLFHVDWYFDSELVGSGATYFATELGVYTAVPSKLIPEVAPNCNYAPATVEVLPSSAAIATVEVTQPFEDIANASVIIQQGIGEYMYQLDNGDFQSSPEFQNISQGLHTITVRDILGNCSDFKIEFRVLKYPKFFTPNNDGSNDTWNIWDLRKAQPNATISIYDKQGKFLKQITPKSYGWDGTYNGNTLPSTDYWFVIDFIEDNQKQQFKSHFSMIR